MTYIVRLNGEMSRRFLCSLGLLTGDPSSPDLWNLYLSDFRVGSYAGDVWLAEIQASKLEQADDIALATPCTVAVQGKLNDMYRWAAGNGCEIQFEKNVIGLLGVMPAHVPSFYLGTHQLEVVRDFQYVGIHFRSGVDNYFVEHYRLSAQKALRVANMSLGVQRIVGDLPVWESRALYMARVDPYLTSGCEVALDVVTSQRESLEKVQHYYLRRMLGLPARSMLAVLFSETGLMPIRYRRLVLALKYLLYLLGLPRDRLASAAMREAYALALSGYGSWFSDMRIVLANLPVPILWTLPQLELLPEHVEALIVDVERSANEWVDGFVLSSPKTRDLLQGRMELEGDKLVKKVLAFRHYLRVKTPKHRRALTHMVLSCHALAMERLRWSERRRPPIPPEFRFCRFCREGLEDVVHALLLCPHLPVQALRAAFFLQVETSLPRFRARYPDPYILIRELLAQRATIALFAKYVWEVFEVFYAEPMFVYGE
ncbi:hypothetical protein FPV67DRAFT_1430995 [Lyophyllum atratum]|nr:hypothetical protein FPV67DRAFT_1430995 [Lyophyllum atratum]